MLNSFSTDGYSSTVSLELVVGGETLDVAQTGAGMLILREPRALAAGPAQLLVTIDGNTDQHEIVLRECSQGPSRKVFFG